MTIGIAMPKTIPPTTSQLFSDRDVTNAIIEVRYHTVIETSVANHMSIRANPDLSSINKNFICNLSVSFRITF